MNLNSRPIAVYDSGLGGLSVLRALIEAFPNEDFVYLGDTAHLPYGAKSPDLLKSLVTRCLNHLQQIHSKIVIVACNSASTVLPEQFDVPLIGVIEAGCEAAVLATRNNSIAVLGTQATVQSHAYRQGILKIKPNADVFEQAAPLLVPLVEEGWIEDPVTNLIVYRYLGPALARKPDTLILGCTHYPFLRSTFQKIVGSSVQLVDSSSVLVNRLRTVFQAHPDFPNEKNHRGRVDMLVTAHSTGYQERAEQFLSPYRFSSFTFQEL